MFRVKYLVDLSKLIFKSMMTRGEISEVYRNSFCLIDDFNFHLKHEVTATTVVDESQVSTKALCNAFADTESETVTICHPVALVFSSCLSFKQSFLVFLIDSFALVSHMDIVCVKFAGIIKSVIHLNHQTDGATMSGVFDRILDQIDYDLLHSHFVNHHRWVFT